MQVEGTLACLGERKGILVLESWLRKEIPVCPLGKAASVNYGKTRREGTRPSSKSLLSHVVIAWCSCPLGTLSTPVW